VANPFAGSKFYARLGNVFTRPLWSVFPAPQGFGVLSTTGRKSGKPRRQSVRAIRDGDSVVVVAMMGERANWLRNVRSDPRVTLRLGRVTLHGVAREVTEESERQWAAKVYIGTIVPSDYTDYITYCWGLPSRRKIEEAHRTWFHEGIPVTIRIESRVMSAASP